MAEAAVLSALSNGCTGVWCAVCEEGATSGHASSLMTLTNLARLGNPHILRKFNLLLMREAAIKITQITSGKEPSGMQEIYGARAFDCLAQSMCELVPEIDPAGFFQVSRGTRMSSIATTFMIRKHLTETFGSFAWSEAVLVDMRKRMLKDLMAGKKYEYQSSVGLLNLYERAKGSEFIAEMVEVIVRDKSYEKYDSHRVMINLRQRFLEHCDMTTYHHHTSHAATDNDTSDTAFNIYVFASPAIAVDDGDAVQELKQKAGVKFMQTSNVKIDEFGLPMVESSDSLLDLMDETTPIRRRKQKGGDNSLNMMNALRHQHQYQRSDSYFHVSSSSAAGYSMSYQQFHKIFLSNWMPLHSPCFKEVVKIFDSDGSGTVEWSELQLRARWALAAFDSESQSWSLEHFIQVIFETFVSSRLSQPVGDLHNKQKGNYNGHVSFAWAHTKTITDYHFHLSAESLSSLDDQEDG